MTIDRMIDILTQLRNRCGGEAAVDFGVDAQFSSAIKYKGVQLRENVETGISEVVIVLTYGSK